MSYAYNKEVIERIHQDSKNLVNIYHKVYPVVEYAKIFIYAGIFTESTKYVLNVNVVVPSAQKSIKRLPYLVGLTCLIYNINYPTENRYKQAYTTYQDLGALAELELQQSMPNENTVSNLLYLKTRADLSAPWVPKILSKNLL